ncbi:MAG: membrane protein [Thermonema sp.]|uniref:DUF92 domain-containing protein n=1 Tax=Thermonema sp. TaxID=2231181 RepID=UPI0021DBA550|nr:DUF92 domain-containing protein [Thermonema sp.]GIV38618.1 MAG: membrane protein [Thermonema sp.]
MHEWAIYLLLAAAAMAAYMLKKLSIAGSIAGWLTASMLLYSNGRVALGCMALFFVAGTAATALHDKHKSGRQPHATRSIANVLSNTTGVWVASLLRLLLPENHFSPEMGLLAVAVSQATALSDTLSSELGQLYGKQCYSILGFRRVTPGEDGGISRAGLLAGLGGSLLMAVYMSFFISQYRLLLLLVAVSWAGNLLDSLLGATWQKQGLLNNHGVNALSNLLTTLAFLFMLRLIGY